jgi:dihydrofolate reductase
VRRVRHGVGMSLDGFIADREGGTDWLIADPTYDPGPYFASIDTVLMGRATFEGAVQGAAQQRAEAGGARPQA